MHIEEQIEEQTVTLRLTAHRRTDRGTNSNTKTNMHIEEQIEEQTVTLRLTAHRRTDRGTNSNTKTNST